MMVFLLLVFVVLNGGGAASLEILQISLHVNILK